jgi:hypothetical protein
VTTVCFSKFCIRVANLRSTQPIPFRHPPSLSLVPFVYHVRSKPVGGQGPGCSRQHYTIYQNVNALGENELEHTQYSSCFTPASAKASIRFDKSFAMLY